MSRRGRQFLFVNKDSSSDTLSRSQAGEKRTILSHVQNKRRTKEAALHAEQWSEESSEVPIRSNFYMARDESVLQQQMESSRKSWQFIRAQSSPARLPLTYPSNNATDPFHATVVGTAAGNHALLSFTFKQSKSIFISEAYAPQHIISQRQTMRHAITMQNRMTRCVEDEMLMNSTLAYGLCSQGWALGRINSDKPPEHFIGETIKSLRHVLSQPDYEIDTWLLLSVYSLAITGYWLTVPQLWTKNPERYAHAQRRSEDSLHTARMHMNAFLQLVQKAGGWECVDPYVMESALLGEMYMSISLMKPPIIPVTWDPGATPPSRVSTKGRGIIPRLGVAFQELKSHLSAELVGIVEDCIDYIRIASALWSNAVVEVTPEDESWLFLRLRALMYRLLSLTPGRYDDCIRIAILTFFCNTIPYHGAQAGARSLLAHLKSALEKVPEDDNILDVRTRLWCLCTGAMTSESSAERDWAICKVAKYVSDRITDEELREVLEEYIFLPTRQQLEFLDMIRRVSLRGSTSEPDILGT